MWSTVRKVETFVISWVWWKPHWFYWDTKEKLTARLVLKYLGSQEALYVHDEKGYPQAVVIPVEDFLKLTKDDDHFLDHSHIEA